MTLRRPRNGGGKAPAAVAGVGLAVGVLLAAPADVASARPSDPGVVNYAVLPKGSVGNIVGATLRFESVFTEPFQAFYVDVPVCNNWADIGLPDVYADPDLASFNGAVAQESPTDATHFVKQAVGVFATNDAAERAFRRVVDRTVGCSGQTTAMHLDNLTTQVWSFTGGPTTATDTDWVKQEAGIDRRCFTTTRKRENVLLQAKVCQPGNGGPAVNVLAGAMQNTLGQ
ncbi:sensor domain-containing protein [Mycobacterium sp. IDR2000157661]|uniref:sensor domain-containing protein n=1 Tax=Mycobacterium sp. IDR2000157661 TaxID=2867005 RepID=UPI001EEF501D|nr:sensor domain-containing protein [Mycobacterium sp. IDR2000157661]ULE34997.1 sensor domain-containing protein [Mycobacterium sp. IDR2000157661]